jgi:hypothetical protein
LAKAKGFQRARLHDVESRKWQLDVQIPIVWSRLWLEDIRFGIKAWQKFGFAGTARPLATALARSSTGGVCERRPVTAPARPRR